MNVNYRTTGLHQLGTATVVHDGRPQVRNIVDIHLGTPASTAEPTPCDGELTNVQSSDAALQRLGGVLEVAVRKLSGPHPIDLVETVPVSGRRRAFEVVAVYPAEAAAVSQARHQLHRLMALTGLETIADAVALGAHELMANAVTHGCRHQAVKAFAVKVTHSGGRLRVEVQDPSSKQPSQRPPSDEREGGRGLFLVDALATAWGVQLGPGRGKTVWMEVDVPGEGTRL
ncbi:ATP-binding protein [Streptomyces sp. NPDC055815]